MPILNSENYNVAIHPVQHDGREMVVVGRVADELDVAQEAGIVHDDQTAVNGLKAILDERLADSNH